MKKKSMLIIAIILMSIGFASISTTLIINGNAKVSENQDDFSVIFTAATLDGKDVYSSAVDDTKKIINFTTSDLKTLNQTSILTYEVTNNSSNYDAEVKVTCVPKDGTTAKYTSIKNKLENDATVVKAKTSLNGTLTVTLDKTSTEEVSEEYTCKLEFNAVERDTVGVELTQFEKDGWETIAANVKSGNTSKYNVGDTKKITIASHTNDCSSATGSGADYVCNSSIEPEKKVTVRIANKSECTTETSETACGFVVEFVDIIDKHNYNKANVTNTNGTNKGGWKDSELRTYINETIYESLPSDLQSVIATTKVISSHGNNSGETNFEGQDKLYLLSSEEIWNDFADSSNASIDSSVGTSKQLDYYKNKGVTTSNSTEAIKQYDGAIGTWWLRTASSWSNYAFRFVGPDGDPTFGALGSSMILSISPAFRIA